MLGTNDSGKCPLCGLAASDSGNAMEGYHFDCNACGKFAMSDQVTDDILVITRPPLSDRQRLSWFSRQLTLKNRTAFFTHKRGFTPPGLSDRFVPISVEEVLEDDAATQLEVRYGLALLNLSRMSAYFGDGVQLRWDTDWPVLYAVNWEEMRFVLGALSELNLVRTDLDSSGGIDVTITPRGWEQVKDLKSGLARGRSSQGFVAMWFGNQSDTFEGRASCDFSADAYLNGLKPGIEAAGYAPLRIDNKDYIGDIKDEILAEIRRSKFVVADLTGQRHGVYFEAGFAMGLAIPVFFTCHVKDIHNVHFDTNHYNHVVWSSPDELASKLKNRILAVLGAPAKASATLSLL